MAISVGEIEAVATVRDQASEVFEKIAGNLEKLGGGFTSFGGAVGAALGIAGAAIGGTLGLITYLGTEGSKIQGVEDAFDRLTASIGSTGGEVMDRLKAGTRGLMDDFDLMRATNKALSAGLEATGSQFELIGAAARVLAKQNAVPLAEAFDQVSAALTTGRTKSLAMMGVMVDQKGATDDLRKSLEAEDEAATTEGLTQAKREAIFKALETTVKGAGGQSLTFAEQITQARIAVGEWFDKLETAVAKSPAFSYALDAITKGVQAAFGPGATDLIDTIVRGLEHFGVILLSVAKGGVDAAGLIVTGWGTIKEAIQRAVEDLAARAAQGLDVLARVGEALGKMPGMSGVRQMTGDLRAWEAGLVAVGVAAGKSADDTARSTIASAAGFARTSASIDEMRARMDAAIGTERGFIGPADEVARKHGDLTQAADDTAKGLKSLGTEVDKLWAGYQNLLAAGWSQDEILKKLGGSIDGLQPKYAELGVRQEDMSVKAKMLQDVFLHWSMEKFTTEVEHSAKVYTEFGQTRDTAEQDFMRAYLTNQKAEEDAAKAVYSSLKSMGYDNLQDQVSFIHAEYEAKRAALDQYAPNYQQALDDLTNAEQVAAAAAQKAWDDAHKGILGSLGDVLSQIPGLIQNAFTGGGGIVGALQGIGSLMGSTLGKSLGEKLGTTIGGSLGTMMGPIGSALGGLVSPLIGWVGGLFHKEEQDVNDLRDAYISAAGGLGALNAKAHDAGKTLDALLHAKTVNDYKAAVDDLNKSLANTAAQQAQLKDLQGQLAAASKMDWQKMQQEAEKYGISLSALGPAFEGAKLHDSATQLWTDFQDLTSKGADVGGVLLGMSDEFSAFVNESRKAGVAIPENFRDIITNLSQAGKLIDENGNAITDLSGIEFGDPVTSQVDQIAKSIEDLTEAIKNGLIPALNGITFPTPPSAGPEPGYQHGTANLDFQSFGRGTRTVLHGNEAVIPQAGTPVLASQIANHLSRLSAARGPGGSGGGGVGGAPVSVSINLHEAAFLTDSSSIRKLADAVGAAFMRQLDARGVRPVFA